MIKVFYIYLRKDVSHSRGELDCSCYHTDENHSSCLSESVLRKDYDKSGLSLRGHFSVAPSVSDISHCLAQNFVVFPEAVQDCQQAESA